MPKQFNEKNPLVNEAFDKISLILNSEPDLPTFYKQFYNTYMSALKALYKLTQGNYGIAEVIKTIKYFLSSEVSAAHKIIFNREEKAKENTFENLQLYEQLFIKMVFNDLMKKPFIKKHIDDFPKSINFQDRILVLPIDMFLLAREEDVKAGAVRAEVYKDNAKIHLSRAGSYNDIFPLNKEEVKLFLQEAKESKSKIVFFTADNSINKGRKKNVINRKFLYEFYGFTLNENQFECDIAANEEEELKLLKRIVSGQKPDDKSQVTLVTSHLISKMLAILEGYTATYADNNYFDRTAGKRHIKELYSLANIRPKRTSKQRKSNLKYAQHGRANKEKQIINCTTEKKFFIPKKHSTNKEHLEPKLVEKHKKTATVQRPTSKKKNKSSQSHILDKEKDNVHIKRTLKKEKEVINHSTKKKVITSKNRNKNEAHFKPKLSKNSKKIATVPRPKSKKKNKKSQSHILSKKKGDVRTEPTLKIDVKDIKIAWSKEIKEKEKELKKKYKTDLIFGKAVTKFFTWYKKELNPKVENVCNSRRHNNVVKNIRNFIEKIKTKEVVINNQVKKKFNKKKYKENLDEYFSKTGGLVETLQSFEERARDNISHQLFGDTIKKTNNQTAKQKKTKRAKSVRHVSKSINSKNNRVVSRIKSRNMHKKNTTNPITYLKKSSKAKTNSLDKRRKVKTVASKHANSTYRKETLIKKSSKNSIPKKNQKRYTDKDKYDYVIWILHNKVFKNLSKLKELSGEGRYIVENYTSIQSNIVNAVKDKLLDDNALDSYLNMNTGKAFPNLVCFIGDNFTSPGIVEDDPNYRPSFYRLFSNAIKKHNLSFDDLLKIKLPSIGQLAQFVIKDEEKFDNFFSFFIKDPILYSNKNIFQLLFLDKEFTVDELTRYIKEKSFPNAKNNVDMYLLQKGYIDHAMEKLQRDVLNPEFYKKNITDSNHNSHLEHKRLLYSNSYQIHVNLKVIKRNINELFKKHQLFPADLLELLYVNDERSTRFDPFILFYFYKSTFKKDEDVNRYKILCDCLSMSIPFSMLLPLLAKDQLASFYSYINKSYKDSSANSPNEINKKLKDIIIINKWIADIISNHKEGDPDEISFIEKNKYWIIGNILKGCDEKLLETKDLLNFQGATALLCYLTFCFLRGGGETCEKSKNKTEDENLTFSAACQKLKYQLVKEGLNFSLIIKLKNAQLEYVLEFIKFKTKTTNKCTLTLKEFIKEVDLFSEKDRFRKKLYVILIEKRFLSFSEYRDDPEKEKLDNFIKKETLNYFTDLKSKSDFDKCYIESKQNLMNEMMLEEIMSSKEINKLAKQETCSFSRMLKESDKLYRDIEFEKNLIKDDNDEAKKNPLKKINERIRLVKLEIDDRAKKSPEIFNRLQSQWCEVFSFITAAIECKKIGINYFPLKPHLLTSNELHIKARNFLKRNYYVLQEIYKAHDPFLRSPQFFSTILKEFDKIDSNIQFEKILSTIKLSEELNDVFFYHYYACGLAQKTPHSNSLRQAATKKLKSIERSTMIQCSERNNYTKDETLRILMDVCTSDNFPSNSDQSESLQFEKENYSDDDSDDDFDDDRDSILKLLTKHLTPKKSEDANIKNHKHSTNPTEPTHSVIMSKSADPVTPKKNYSKALEKKKKQKLIRTTKKNKYAASDFTCQHDKKGKRFLDPLETDSDKKIKFRCNDTAPALIKKQTSNSTSSHPNSAIKTDCKVSTNNAVISPTYLKHKKQSAIVSRKGTEGVGNFNTPLAPIIKNGLKKVELMGRRSKDNGHSKRNTKNKYVASGFTYQWDRIIKASLDPLKSLAYTGTNKIKKQSTVPVKEKSDNTVNNQDTLSNCVRNKKQTSQHVKKEKLSPLPQNIVGVFNNNILHKTVFKIDDLDFIGSPIETANRVKGKNEKNFQLVLETFTTGDFTYDQHTKPSSLLENKPVNKSTNVSTDFPVHVDTSTVTYECCQLILWMGCLGVIIGFMIAPENYLLIAGFMIDGSIMGFVIGKAIDSACYHYCCTNNKQLKINEIAIKL